jgi:NADH:ubiquinone oxidoreductase subunit K
MTNEASLLYNYLMVGGALFALGMIGFLVRRNMIVMFLCAEMMLQGVSVSLVGWGRFHGDWGGQMLVIFIVTVAACEAGIAMALILMLAQRSGKLDAPSGRSFAKKASQPTSTAKCPKTPTIKSGSGRPSLRLASSRPKTSKKHCIGAACKSCETQSTPG